MQTGSMEYWKDLLSHHLNTEKIKQRLDDTLEEIKLLESIYMTGGENHVFSEEFSQAAFKECQNLCQLSSACYSILRERGEKI